MDDRGALCQVRSPKENKETFDDLSLLLQTVFLKNVTINQSKNPAS